MPPPPDQIFRSLADPTRRALFESLCREGEQTVRALTAQAGISQPAVSKHLGILKSAGLVRDRPAGRQVHYSAHVEALAPLTDWAGRMTGFWEARLDDLDAPAQENGPMTRAATAVRSVMLEREFAHPPEKLWRALTQPHLVAEWLMPADIAAETGHRFAFSADWGRIDCEVIEVDPGRVLAYRWDGMGLESVVTWTLTPTERGTLLRIDQTGFAPDQDQAYYGARAGWPRFLKALDALLDRVD